MTLPILLLVQTDEELQEAQKKRAQMRKRVAVAARAIRCVVSQKQTPTHFNDRMSYFVGR